MTIAEDRAAEDVVGTAISSMGSANGSPTLIPTYRYTSPEFAKVEVEKVFGKAWLVACSVDHVAEPGDYFEYRAGPYSVLIVRGDDGALRAFQNACRHRGNIICEGAGNGLTELRCTYHNWVWDLQGRLRQVPSRKGFGALRNDDLPLLPARVDTFGRLVFVNLDPEAMSLAEYLEGVPADIAWIDPDAYRCTRMITTGVPANWKVLSEGFSETYHVQGLHAEMLACIDDINAGQFLWERHGVSKQRYGVPSPRLRDVDAQAVWDSFVLTQGMRVGHDQPCPVPEIPEGRTVQDVIAARIRERAADKGVDLSRFDTDQVTTLNQYNLFPNVTLLFNIESLSVMYALPGDGVDHAGFVVMSFDRVASPDAPRTHPQNASIPEGMAVFGQVINQDIELLRNAQRGLQQPGLTHLALSSEECRILNMHRTLERYCGIEPSEMTGGPVR
jgi:choline monooxygenase